MTDREKYELLIGKCPWERGELSRDDLSACRRGSGGDKSSGRLVVRFANFANERVSRAHTRDKAKEKVGEATKSFSQHGERTNSSFYTIHIMRTPTTDRESNLERDKG